MRAGRTAHHVVFCIIRITAAARLCLFSRRANDHDSRRFRFVSGPHRLYSHSRVGRYAKTLFLIVSSCASRELIDDCMYDDDRLPTRRMPHGSQNLPVRKERRKRKRQKKDISLILFARSNRTLCDFQIIVSYGF